MVNEKLLIQEQPIAAVDSQGENPPLRPHWRKITALLVLSLGAVFFGLPVGTAMAQVAVPEVAPAGMRVLNTGFPIFTQTGFTPENPAAMQFGAPSRVGGGVLQGSSNDDDFGGKGKDYTGSYAGLRLAVQRISLAAESSNYEVIYPLATISEENESFAFSFSFPEWLAFGFGADNHTRTVGTNEYQVVGSVFGVSMKSENLSAGFASGQEVGRDVTNAVKGTRGYSAAGVAWRKGGTVIFHIEANMISNGNFEDTNGAQVLQLDFYGYEHQQVIVEAGFSDFFLGGSMVQTSSLAGAGDIELNGYSVDYGYMPFNGPTFTGRYEFSERTKAGTRVAAETVNSIQATYQF